MPVVSIDLDPAGLVRSAAELRVYVGGTDPSAPDWRLAPAPGSAVESLVLRSGREPSSARISLEAGPDFARVFFGAGPDGAAGRALLEPEGFRLHSLVRVAALAGAAEETVFLGLVAAHRYDLAAERFTVECRDFRWLLEKVPVRGRRAAGAGGEEFFQAAALPVFNAGGAPDRCALAGWPPAFAPPQAPWAARWKRGDVWNYLRRQFNAAPPAGLLSTAAYLEWPEAAPGGQFGFLFEAGGHADAAPELALGGLSLAAALQALLGAGGGAPGLDWTLEPAGDKARLVAFRADAPDENRRALVLRRGAPGGELAAERPEVAGGAVTLDAGRMVTAARALGAPERYDATFDTLAGTLAPGWTAADQAAWLALPEAERARAFPDVFARWTLPAGFDWTKVFAAAGEEALFLEERGREFGALLLSADAAAPGAAGAPARLPLQVWRSTDGGASWEPPPGGVAAAPLAGECGVRLSPAARQALVRAPGGAAAPWSWDGSAGAWHLRVTASVAADRRPERLAAASPAGWPAGETLLVLPGCRCDARREAVIPAREGQPSAGGEPALFGHGAPAALRDDGEQLAAAAARELADRARPALTAEVLVPGLRADVAPGDYLERLAGGGERPDLEVRAAVRRVEWRVAEQLTVISAGGAS